MSTDIYKSLVNLQGNMAGVFEYDGDVAYFYLLDLSKKKGGQIVGSIPIFSGETNIREEEVSIAWSKSDQMVGLRIHEQLWAVFGPKGEKLGGRYAPDKKADISDEVVFQFN